MLSLLNLLHLSQSSCSCCLAPMILLSPYLHHPLGIHIHSITITTPPLIATRHPENFSIILFLSTPWTTHHPSRYHCSCNLLILLPIMLLLRVQNHESKSIALLHNTFQHSSSCSRSSYCYHEYELVVTCLTCILSLFGPHHILLFAYY